MNSKKIRNIFFDYFESKGHKIIESAPITVKDDPTLMFTNAGMNQFKNIFLGDETPKTKRVANTQKCLRVSGKHNDLEEVGIDKYHHTMFEMLGNWSFGDYFKKDAIHWAWDLLVNHYKLDPKRLYITVFGGDKNEKLHKDTEAVDIWKEIVNNEKIIDGSKNDNFWEMGDTGPCGPCSEIHIDLRSKKEIEKLPTAELINKDHPEVIEIWNLVFIEFNRRNNGTLESLPNKHVDTGMGLERLSMAIEGLNSTYDTDLFKSIIESISELSNLQYGKNNKHDIAFRVISDHIRAIVFTISDGAIPSNNKSGYVIRRILRRAVRYGFSTLEIKSPFLHKLAKSVIGEYKNVFTNLKSQENFILNLILEEEKTFLNTLENGLKKINKIKEELDDKNKLIPGDIVFELYDTYGFPYDLTELIARENNLQIDKKSFENYLEEQRDRSRKSSEKSLDEWQIVNSNLESEFHGYENYTMMSKIVKFREVNSENTKKYHIVFSDTPFYAESGGQVGDIGYFSYGEEKINIENTFKENELIIHLADRIPSDLNSEFKLSVNSFRRKLISKNHSATHLLHSALREVLGDHVTQKGSLVNDKILRFDFSHFTKISDNDLNKISDIVNNKIFDTIGVEILNDLSIDKAKKMGAMALFGEKYGDKVRVVIIDKKFSTELCGGTHVSNTSDIGLFKIISEGSISSGIRRIEALTSRELKSFSDKQSKDLTKLKELLKSNNLVESVSSLLKKNKILEAQINKFDILRKNSVKDEIKKKVNSVNNSNLILHHFQDEKVDFVKQIGFELEKEFRNIIFLATTELNQKPSVVLLISKTLIKDFQLDARMIIKDLSKHIEGSGGGQDFLSTAGGKKIEGLKTVLAEGQSYFNKVLNN